MDHPVVVGYNGKKPAEAALIWAANEAAQRGVRLVVLFAANYPGMTLPQGEGQPEAAPGALDAAQEVTAQGVVAAKAAHPGLEVRGETTANNPTQALLEAAPRASLVVVGSRGRGTVVGALLGSVSFSVASASTCPVAVVKRESDNPSAGSDHPVIVGTDGSAAASNAVRFAAQFAANRSATLQVICSMGADDAVSDNDQRRLRDSAGEILKNVRADLERTHPELTLIAQVTDGAAERALVDASADAGLIVVGTRGRGAFQGMVAGSVSLAVIHRAHCPVVVVRGTEPPAEVTDTGGRRHGGDTPRRVSLQSGEMANVHVRAQRLPGVGWQYTVPADRGKQLMIVVEGTGDRHLVLVDPALEDPLETVRLTSASSSVAGALLAGARFHIEHPGEHAAGSREPDQTVVEVLDVRGGSPAVGRVADEVIRELDVGAALLGVIRDQTAEAMEPSVGRPIEAGQKLVVAVRQSEVDSVRSALGPA